MAQHNAFTWSCKQYIVFPNDVTTTHVDKSNIPGFARTRNAVTTKIFYIVKVNASHVGGGLTQHQRGPRWRVDLLVVVTFNNLDVEFFTKHCRNLLRQLR